MPPDTDACTKRPLNTANLMARQLHPVAFIQCQCQQTTFTRASIPLLYSAVLVTCKPCTVETQLVRTTSQRFCVPLELCTLDNWKSALRTPCTARSESRGAGPRSAGSACKHNRFSVQGAPVSRSDSHRTLPSATCWPAPKTRAPSHRLRSASRPVHGAPHERWLPESPATGRPVKCARETSQTHKSQQKSNW